MSDLFAPPSQDELAHAHAAHESALFSPPSDDEIAAARPDSGKFESVVSGLAHGLTLGQSDKIIAGSRALLAQTQGGTGKVGDLYNQYLDEQLGRSKRLRDENTKSYVAGDLLGGLVTPANKLLPSGGLLTNIATGAGVGALAATGQSNAHPLDSPQQASRFLSDAATGAKWGAAGGVAGSALGAGLEAAKALPKKGASAMLGASEDAIDRYIARPESVMTSPGPEDVTRELRDVTLPSLRNQVTSGSKAARGLLGPESEFKGLEIANILQKHIDDIVQRSEGALDDDAQATIAWLKSQQEPWLKISEGAVGPAESNATKAFSGSRMKDLVQKTQKQAEGAYDLMPQQFAGADQQLMKNVSAEVNQTLKQRAPDYANAMDEVARKTKLLDRAGDLYTSDQGLMNTLNRVRRDKAPFAEETLQDIDNEFGTDYIEKLRDSLARESFEKGSQGPGGSRMVNAWKELGGTNPIARGALGMFGAVVDKDGPKMAQSGINAASALHHSPAFQAFGAPVAGAIGDSLGNPNITSAVTQYVIDRRREAPAQQKPAAYSFDIENRLKSDPASLGSYAQPLEAAAQRGPSALAATHFVLSQRDPAYQALLLDQGSP